MSELMGQSGVGIRRGVEGVEWWHHDAVDSGPVTRVAVAPADDGGDVCEPRLGASVPFDPVEHCGRCRVRVTIDLGGVEHVEGARPHHRTAAAGAAGGVLEVVVAGGVVVGICGLGVPVDGDGAAFAAAHVGADAGPLLVRRPPGARIPGAVGGDGECDGVAAAVAPAGDGVGRPSGGGEVAPRHLPLGGAGFDLGDEPGDDLGHRRRRLHDVHRGVNGSNGTSSSSNTTGSEGSSGGESKGSSNSWCSSLMVILHVSGVSVRQRAWPLPR
jgi:hypothetical protein